MEKGITLQAHMHAGNDSQAIDDLMSKLPAAFARANPGLKLSVKKASAPDAKGNISAKVYIEGDQDPASDFSALAHSALNNAITALNAVAKKASGGSATPATPVQVHSVHEVEGDDESTDVTLAPNLRPDSSTKASVSTAPAPAPEPDAAKAFAPWWAFWRRGNS